MTHTKNLSQRTSGDAVICFRSPIHEILYLKEFIIFLERMVEFSYGHLIKVIMDYKNDKSGCWIRRSTQCTVHYRKTTDRPVHAWMIHSYPRFYLRFCDLVWKLPVFRHLSLRLNWKRSNSSGIIELFPGFSFYSKAQPEIITKIEGLVKRENW